jgi:2-dehydro-3-deoxyglucarate aldolase|tara:strand:- start:49 stop:810 length:762 start_codon:yes stop_codon:yes gene_type:complete
MNIELIKFIRKKLQTGKPSIGSWMQIPNSSLAEIMGQAGYDWITVDLEHGSISVHQLPDIFRAIQLGGTLPLARIANPRPDDCKQALDAGAGGIIIPMVENANQVKTIRKACCWPPVGNRGVGFSRANLFGKHFDEYQQEAQSPMLIAQIEHINAVNNLEEILQVEGLDAIIVGPYDLSASMGITAQFENTQFKKVLTKIMEACVQHNVTCGYHVVEPKLENVTKRISQGYKFIAYCSDGIFLNTSSQCPIKK